MIGLRILCLVIGYAFGCFQTAYILGRINGIDIRNYGSGNAGTTNAIRVLGTKAGLMVFVGDMLKTLFALLLVGALFGKAHPEYVYLLKSWAFMGVVLGHDYPFYMGFKGGKGVACMAGFALGYHWTFLPASLLLFLVPYLATTYVSLGSLMVYGGTFIQMIIEGQMGFFKGASQATLIEMYVIQFFLTFMAYYRHRANIGRLLTGTERKTYLFKSNTEKLVWSIMKDETDMINNTHQQSVKLPGVVLDDSVTASTDLEEVMRDKDMLVLAVPSSFVRSTARNMAKYCRYGQLIVSVAKGIEEDTLLTMSEVIKQEIPHCEAAVLCGPTHAEEVGIGLPTAIVAGAARREVAEYIQSVFMGRTFRVYTSPDMLGMHPYGRQAGYIFRPYRHRGPDRDVRLHALEEPQGRYPDRQGDDGGRSHERGQTGRGRRLQRQSSAAARRQIRGGSADHPRSEPRTVRERSAGQGGGRPDAPRR